jgi:hypothetical protein
MQWYEKPGSLALSQGYPHEKTSQQNFSFFHTGVRNDKRKKSVFFKKFFLSFCFFSPSHISEVTLVVRQTQ